MVVTSFFGPWEAYYEAFSHFMVFLYETFRHLFWKKGPLYGLTVAADSELMSLLLSVDCSCQAVYWIFFLLFFSHFPFSHNLSLLSEPELRHVCSLPFPPLPMSQLSENQNFYRKMLASSWWSFRAYSGNVYCASVQWQIPTRHTEQEPFTF